MIICVSLILFLCNNSVLSKFNNNIPTKEIAPNVHMPLLNIGCGGKDAGHTDVIKSMVTDWLNLGGRGIDTALDYRDQSIIAEVIQNSGISRKDLFITSKCGAGNGYLSTLRQVYSDLKQLNTTYIDLMLIHFPGKDNKGSWKALEYFHSQGILKSIGVSQFNITHLNEILPTATVIPAVNQNLLNVLSHDDGLISFCKNNNITFESFSPLGRGSTSVLENPTIEMLGKTHNKTNAQVALRWIIQNNNLVTTQADQHEYAIEDMDIFNWSLSDQEMDKLDELQT